ncbi:MAG: sugar phosphate nucleotidyltransferase [Tissierellia bacterium]|nr:sugar phosphate nucleotidyltransferase [Tissierellia bacterium]
MKTTLVIMAAGLGSRYGKGIKQLAKMDDFGNTLMDYSIYDAINAGFDKVVFIIREDIKDEFMEVIGERIKSKVEIDLAFQDINDLPHGFSKPSNRNKPWGTVQAIISSKKVVNEPFLVINADDYYGKEAFKLMHEYLLSNVNSEELKIGMVGYRLKNTISENGTVNRGICLVNDDGKLKEIKETHDIINNNGVIESKENLSESILNLNSVVSMNVWASYPKFIDYSEQYFEKYLEDNKEKLDTLEYVIPDMVDQMLKDGLAEVDVLPTKEKWIGITYHEDLKTAVNSFKQMKDDGLYPENIWES